MPRSRDESAVLAASEAGIGLILAKGTLRVSVADLADAAGIPQRTFYRWFASKEQVLRPVFDWGTDIYAELLAASSDPLEHAVESAFEAVLWGELEPRTRGLFPLVFADPNAQAVFFFAVHDGEHRILEPLAGRLGLPADTVEVRAAAAAVTASLRIALEHLVSTGEDPRPLHARLLRAFALDTRAAVRGPSGELGGRGEEPK